MARMQCRPLRRGKILRLIWAADCLYAFNCTLELRESLVNKYKPSWWWGRCRHAPWSLVGPSLSARIVFIKGNQRSEYNTVDRFSNRWPSLLFFFAYPPHHGLLLEHNLFFLSWQKSRGRNLEASNQNHLRYHCVNTVQVCCEVSCEPVKKKRGRGQNILCTRRWFKVKAVWDSKHTHGDQDYPPSLHVITNQVLCCHPCPSQRLDQIETFSLCPQKASNNKS